MADVDRSERRGPVRPEGARGPARPEAGRGVRGNRERRWERHRQQFKDANFSSAIYGEILVLSVLAALDTAHAHAGVVLETVVASQLVFWLAHAYAESIERQLHASAEGTGIGWRGVVDVMEHEWPMVQAAGPTAVFLILSLAGVMTARLAIDLSFGFAVVALFGWGLIAARRNGRPFIAQLIVGAFSGAFGLGIVALKLLINH